MIDNKFSYKTLSMVIGMLERSRMVEYKHNLYLYESIRLINLSLVVVGIWL